MLGQRLLGTCTRIAARAVFAAGSVDLSCPSGSSHQRAFSSSSPSTSAEPNAKPEVPSTPHSTEGIVVRCAGFPKDMANGASTVREEGVYGDDACFITHFKNILVAGVADGVGGWRKYGIDPSQFSRRLMKECEKRVNVGAFDPKKPELLIAKAFKATAAPPRPIGSSTACVVVVTDHSLYSANLGDSGFIVIRDGKVVARSCEQTHYFNAPFQLTSPPEGFEGFIGDSPLSADRHHMQVVSGDVIVMGTDGLWDNMSEERVIREVAALSKGADVQQVCNSIALSARRLSLDDCHQSPFALKAREHGYDFPGGKPDDITLVVILIQ